MKTVRELIDELEQLDEDMEVCIGMQQRYGSDFAYGVCEPFECEVNDWDDDRRDMVVLTMGRQFGTVRLEEF